MASNNLIFLDIDGVLDYRAWFSNPIRKFIYGKFSKESVINRRNLFWVGLLCKVTHAKVVMSSSWRYAWDTETGKLVEDAQSYKSVDMLFRKNGIDIIGTTGNRVDALKNKYELDEDIIDYYTTDKFEKSGLKLSRGGFLAYARGTQILDWIEKHNYTGNYVILDDDISEIKLYKTLESHIVKSSFYGWHAGFGFKHFIKALKMLRTKNV